VQLVPARIQKAGQDGDCSRQAGTTRQEILGGTRVELGCERHGARGDNRKKLFTSMWWAGVVDEKEGSKVLSWSVYIYWKYLLEALVAWDLWCYFVVIREELWSGGARSSLENRQTNFESACDVPRYPTCSPSPSGDPRRRNSHILMLFSLNIYTICSTISHQQTPTGR
jgi:hypothetical protein